jgi:pimeloyl-ACP methyl ester carboxylesterase
MNIGWGLALAGLCLACVLAATLALTPSGAGYAASAALAAAGLIGVLRWGRRALLASLAGVLLALGVAGARLALAARPEGPLRVVVLGTSTLSDRGTRLVNALADEQDLLILGEGLMRLLGGVSRREHAGLAPALAAGYAEVRAAEGVFASPVPSTYLFWQRPAAFDAVIVEPEQAAAPQAGVVFLHGFMGNVSLQCWHVAGAARPLGMVTLCPSTGWVGEWWQPAAEETVRASLRYLRARGIERLYVGGFSNGGAGVSQLAPRLAAEPGVAGLFFIAGVNNAEAIAGTGLPVLIIQGAGDERMPASAARRAAAEIGAAATYVELEADHFLIVKQSAEVQAVLNQWLPANEKVAK